MEVREESGRLRVRYCRAWLRLIGDYDTRGMRTRVYTCALVHTYWSGRYSSHGLLSLQRSNVNTALTTYASDM